MGAQPATIQQTAAKLAKLTAKQRKFAALVAGGETQAQAHRKAYGGKGNRNTTTKQAVIAARNPAVQSEIERLRVELLPAVTDMRAVYDHALAVIVKASTEAKDERVRVDAAKWLRAEGERQLERLRAVSEPQRDPEAAAIVEQLRAIYAKAKQPAAIDTVPAAGDGDVIELAAIADPEAPIIVQQEPPAPVTQDTAPEPAATFDTARTRALSTNTVRLE